MSKLHVPDHEILELIRRRWSPRAFADRLVEPQLLNQVFEAARWAPSAFNAQPWRFIVAPKQQPDAHEKLLACLLPGNQLWARHAPVLMIACAETINAHNGKPNAWARYDVGQAVAYLSLQATELGLFVHQMAGFNPEITRQTLGIPESAEPVVALAIGYLGDAASLPEDLKLRETAPGKREPIGAFVFGSRWGQANG